MSEVFNLIGMSTGIVLYAMLLAMVVRTRRPSTAFGGVDPLLLATALLGLVWNLCALPAYELPKLGALRAWPLLTALGFSALGFLPAVAVHSVLRGQSARRGRHARLAFMVVAYSVAWVAAGLQFAGFVRGTQVPSVLALRLLTYTFVALVLPLAALTRGQPVSRRALWAAALSVFAVSALHLSQFEQGETSWPVELVGHHASLPLAFAVLYQDFPFALADLFLKRALTLFAVVAMAFVGVATVGTVATFGSVPLRGVRAVGVLVVLWVLTALVYPRLRDLVAWFVDTVVLHRPDYVVVERRLAADLQDEEDVPHMLDGVCAALAPALSAEVVVWRQEDPVAPRDVEAGESVHTRWRGSAAVIPVPVTEPPRYAIHASGLTGGRRLLSDDHAALASIAALLARRIDAVRITGERHERALRERAIAQLATEAELRALRAQINPHFLFNTLTTIGYLIQTAPPRALDTLMRLTELLRGVLRSEGEFTTLGRELALIEAYLSIEYARFEQRLRVRIGVSEGLRDIRIPSLILQPLVENAVKHGIAPARAGGEVSIEGCLIGSDGQAILQIIVRDTGSGATANTLNSGRRRGVGLRNVQNRLACHYGDRASLSVTSVPGQGTVVAVRLPSGQPATATVPAQVAG